MRTTYFKYKLVCLIYIITFSVKAQVEKCASATLHNQQMATNPIYNQKMLDYEMRLLKQKNKNVSVSGTVYQIPTVVHVMHKGEAIGSGVNISDVAIQNAIKALNQQFRKIPGTPWNGNGVDAEIEYVLAVRDPLGNCTNGITRTNMSGNSTYMNQGVDAGSGQGISDASLKITDVWDQTKYYNIWVISEIDNNSARSGVHGYAFFASTNHGLSNDGMVILAIDMLDGISTTLSHEIGHSLNLYHTFEGDGIGGTCPSGAGDFCADTPPHKRSLSDCVVGTNACDGGSSTNLFIHNYMDYSSSMCQNMLTADQKTRMIAALTVDRASFLASNGNMSLVPPSAPVVDFDASTSVLCSAGQSVSFIDRSMCVLNTYLQSSSFAGITHSWTATNGINTYTSSAQNPVITFANPGTYTVTLHVTNANGTNSITKTDMVIISASPATVPCIPTSLNIGNFLQTISNVSFNTIHHSSSVNSNTPYTDLVCTENTIVTAGNNYTLSINANGTGDLEQFEVYIDYNNNNSFTDPGEFVASGSTPMNTSTTFNTNILIPTVSVKNTLLRMRVIGESGTMASDAKTCGSQMNIGDVKDYGVYIHANCTTPTLSLISTNTSVCPGNSIVLDVSGALTYTWLPSGSGPSNTVTPSATTVYTVTGESNGCYSAPITVTVTMASLPVLTVTATNTVICSADASTITLAASGASTYTWLPSLTIASTIDVSPTSTTIYTVIGYNGSCYSLPQTTTITVKISPTITVTPTSNVICIGNTFTMSVSGASSYTWLPVPGVSLASNNSVRTETANSSVAYPVFGETNGCFSNTLSVTIDAQGAENFSVTTTNSVSCSGSAVSFTAAGAVTYTWLPSVFVGAIIDVYPTSITIYTVVGTTSAGCLTIVKTVTATAGTVPILTVSATNTIICDGQNTTITAIGANTYTWSPLSVSASTAIVTPTASTTYTLIGNSGSCNSLPGTITISVTPLPIVSILPNNPSICVGQNTVLTATGAITYTWFPVGSGSTNTVSPSFNTVYSVVGTQDNCISALTSVTVIVSAIPTITVNPLSTSICTGDATIINVSGAATYSWLPSGSGNSFSVSPNATTVYTIAGYNSNCVSTKKTVTVTVNPVPTITLSTLSVSICKGASTTLGASGASSYAWLPSGSGPVNIVNPNATTIYTVVGNKNGCNSAPKMVTVNVTQTPTVTISPSNTTICSGQSAVLTASGASSFTWQPFSIGNTVTITPVTSVTTYTVIGDVTGCLSNLKTVTVYMLSSPTLTVSATPASICNGKSSTILASGASNYTWTPGNLTSASNLVSPTITTTYTVNANYGSNCESSTTLLVTVNVCAGIEDLSSSNDIIVYPNPNNGVFTIAIGAVINTLDVSVINSLGQLVKTETAKNTDRVNMDLDSINQGIYYVKITSNSGSKLFKIIVE